MIYNDQYFEKKIDFHVFTDDAIVKTLSRNIFSTLEFQKIS